MKDFIALFCGKSGTGKTTIVNALEKDYGLKNIQSYTTRPRRQENEYGHIFVTQAEKPADSEMVAYTKYNGNEYWATQKQVEECELYVIDYDGIEKFVEKYRGNKDIIIINIVSNAYTRFIRMLQRNDTIAESLNRIENDAKAFQDEKLVNVLSNNKNVYYLQITNNMDSAIKPIIVKCYNYLTNYKND